MTLPVARYRSAWLVFSVGSFGALGCATSDKSLVSVDYREPGPLADASLGGETGGRTGGSGAGGESSGGKAGASSGGAGEPGCVDANCPAVGPLTGCCTPTGVCGVSFGTTCFAFPAGAAGAQGGGGAPGTGGRNAGAGGGGRGGSGGRGGASGAAGRAGSAGRGGTGGEMPADSGAPPSDASDARD